MGFKIVIKPLAVLDIDDAIIWYEQKQQGLGKRFFLSVNEAIQKIEKAPYNYLQITKDVRRILLKNFPFKIFYPVSDETVFILGLLHEKRSKSSVRKRIR